MTFTSALMFYRDLMTCNSFEEVNNGIKTNGTIICSLKDFIGTKNNLTTIILNTKTQTFTDVYIQEGKLMSFPVAETVSCTYEEEFPAPTVILCYSNFYGGFGGGTFEYTLCIES